MPHTLKTKMVSWFVVIGWMSFIFYLSHQPATASSELSAGITAWVIKVSQFITPLDIDMNHLHFLIRKGAHFFAYFILGILVMNALTNRRLMSYRHVAIAFVICVLYAISDEIHQLFIPGRSGQLIDVWIDSVGAIVGIGISHLAHHKNGRKAACWKHLF